MKKEQSTSSYWQRILLTCLYYFVAKPLQIQCYYSLVSLAELRAQPPFVSEAFCLGGAPSYPINFQASQYQILSHRSLSCLSTLNHSVGWTSEEQHLRSELQMVVQSVLKSLVSFKYISGKCFNFRGKDEYVERLQHWTLFQNPSIPDGIQ